MYKHILIDVSKIEQDAQKYANAHGVLTELRRYQRKLTGEEYLEIRRQALRGDVYGARDKLRLIVWAR